MGRLLSSDPIRKITRTFHYSPHDETAVVVSKQDVRDLQEINRAQHSTYRGAWEKHGEYGDLVARLPAVIVGDLIQKGIFLDDARFLAWLDDRDNSDWRTRPGRLSRYRSRVRREALS